MKEEHHAIESSAEAQEDGTEGSDDKEERLWLAGIRQRSLESFDAVVERYETMLQRSAWLFLGSGASVEDVVQETFFAVWDGAGRTDSRTRLRPWIFAIMFNQCRKHIRGEVRRRKREQTAVLDPLCGMAEAEDSGNLRQERAERLQKALSLLDEEQKELVILKYERNWKLRDIAEAAGIPLGTVQSRLGRAVARLRLMVTR